MSTATMSSSPSSPPSVDPVATRRSAAVRFGLGIVLLPLCFFLSAGSFAWWQAWAWCGVVFLPMLFFVAWVAWRSPEFLARRLKLKEGTQEQRRIVSGSWPAVVGILLLPGLDYRFGWSHVPLAVQLVALALAAVSYLGILWVFAVNPWAGRTVETVPGQEVVSRGPYAVVRHPMYAFGLFFYLATPLALGSWWAIIPGAFTAFTFVQRLVHEESFLLRELPGYAAYVARVRSRLIPGLW